MLPGHVLAMHRHPSHVLAKHVLGERHFSLNRHAASSFCGAFGHGCSGTVGCCLYAACQHASFYGSCAINWESSVNLQFAPSATTEAH